MDRAPSLEERAKEVMLFDRFRRVLIEGNSRGIWMAPLKGAHLLTSVYPEHRSRSVLADVDFLVREADFERTEAMLRSLGFSCLASPGRPVTDASRYTRPYVLKVSEHERILFEPHRGLVQNQRHPIDYDQVWERSVLSTFEGIPCRRLASEDHVLHAVIHQITDCFAGARRGLADIEFLIERGGADLRIVAERASEWKCARATWLLLRALAARRPDLVHAEVLARLAPGRIRSAVLEEVFLKDAEIRIPSRDSGGRRALTWSILLDDAAQVIRFSTWYGKLRLKDVYAVLANAYT